MGRIFSDWLEIAQKCEQVSAALTTVDTWDAWRTGFVRVDLDPEEEFRVGLRWKETRSVDGREQTHDLVVTDFVPNESLSIIVDGDRYKNKAGAAFLEYRLVDYEDDTTLHLDTKLDTLAWPMRLFAGADTAGFLKLCRQDLDGLKRYLEKDIVSQGG